MTDTFAIRTGIVCAACLNELAPPYPNHSRHCETCEETARETLPKEAFERHFSTAQCRVNESEGRG